MLNQNDPDQIIWLTSITGSLLNNYYRIPNRIRSRYPSSALIDEKRRSQLSSLLNQINKEATAYFIGSMHQ